VHGIPELHVFKPVKLLTVTVKIDLRFQFSNLGGLETLILAIGEAIIIKNNRTATI